MWFCWFSRSHRCVWHSQKQSPDASGPRALSLTLSSTWDPPKQDEASPVPRLRHGLAMAHLTEALWQLVIVPALQMRRPRPRETTRRAQGCAVRKGRLIWLHISLGQPPLVQGPPLPDLGGPMGSSIQWDKDLRLVCPY